MKKIIRLTESDLTRIVKKVLKEQSLSDLGKLPKTSKSKDPKCKKGDCKNGYGEYYWDNDNYYKGNSLTKLKIFVFIVIFYIFYKFFAQMA
jgi:hypothetical protein